jgi:2-desacetyl-2-hydroxyethyl bacteriochlorophyllide A dehydrogenase
LALFYQSQSAATKIVVLYYFSNFPATMKAQTLTFTAPYRLELIERELPPIGAEQVLVQTLVSAISPGTEMLVYRGQCPALDDPHDRLSSKIDYPTAYGYACVGQVVEIGKQIDKSWRDRLVFAFQPHASRFITNPSCLIPLPENIFPQTACFLPNIETAVNLAQDAAPILGERVLVLGQGVVGLLVAALLRQFPLETLVTTDFYPLRRTASQALGVDFCLDAGRPDLDTVITQILPSGADLTLEVSGSPLALDTAIEHTTFSGRIVIGSWYGQKTAAIRLGGKFHRSRIRIISSQVSTISPELSGRWDKSRRFSAAWDALARIQPEQWITHRFPLEKAEHAYRLLDEHPQDAIQVLLEYPA